MLRLTVPQTPPRRRCCCGDAGRSAWRLRLWRRRRRCWIDQCVADACTRSDIYTTVICGLWQLCGRAKHAHARGPGGLRTANVLSCTSAALAACARVYIIFVRHARMLEMCRARNKLLSATLQWNGFVFYDDDDDENDNNMLCSSVSTEPELPTTNECNV